MDAFLTFAAFIAALLVFLATGIPVAVAMGIIGMIGTVIFVSPSALIQVASTAFHQTTSFVLVVVPLFILMGDILAQSGIGARLFRAAQLWLRRMPGALAVGTILACAGFASVCGSSPVTAATIGSMSVPEMIKRGYDKSLALGATAAGGTLGILIPPSVPMVLYGVITETSIGTLFVSAIIPGLIMTALIAGTVIVLVLFKPHLAPKLTERVEMAEKWSALAQVLPVIILTVLVIGSIYFGVATPTEAGAVGVLGALIIALALKSLSWPKLRHCLDNTAKTTAMFLLLLVGGLFSSFVLTRLGVPQGMSAFLTGLDVPGWVILVAINVLLLIMGMFLDPMSILVIVVPIFLKTVVDLGYSPVWFGIIVTIQIELAAITPPVGFNLFVLKSVVPGVDLQDVVRGAVIFVIPLLLGIVLLSAAPGIVSFLPNLVK
jgi:C4-dicarboxylate transporter DctM subunit